jgi:DNA repair protein RecN (Recombination protein N)
MLKSLSISNYALIESLEMEPATALNMITGETGAGKSIMLGAVGLLLGNRADIKALFDEDKKCIIEGLFDIATYGLEFFFEEEDLDHDSQCIIRREILPSGKSRAFINDTPVRLEVLKVLGKSLVDIHSQHDNLMLGAADYQLSLIDAFAESKAELGTYSKTYKRYQKTKKALDKLSKEAFELRKEADYNQFQLEELSVVKFVAGEQTGLEEQQRVLEHAEEIKAKINEALEQLHADQFGAMSSLGQVNQHLGQLARFGHTFSDLKERFNSVLIELNDIAATLEDENEKLEVDYDKLAAVTDRLSKIYQLQQKHGVDTVEELIQIESELADKALQIGNLDEELTKLQQEAEVQWQELLEAGALLSAKRKVSFETFSENIVRLLAQLGMENAMIEVVGKTVDPTAMGTDEIEIMFSANKGIKPQAIRQVASGGEFSRLMFAIKYIMADKMALPTLIFDEIDTGISGEVAFKMVSMMQEIAKKHQVICISHLPQVAAKGEKHYFVYKDNSTEKTISKIKLLSPAERETEIAKMIAGSNPSATAFESARELLRQ